MEPTNRNSENKYKYLVDCERIKSDSTSLDIQTGAMRDKHVIVLEAVIADKTLSSQNKKIIVKIGETNAIIKREYEVAKRLESTNNPGYIRMNCLFSCGHNMDKYRRNGFFAPDTFQICETQDKNNIDVLVMPYIGDGTSLYDVGADHYKELVKQVVINSSNAFKKTGFIHKDLHFGNIVIDNDGNTIILDFDTSEFVDLRNPECYSYFWSDMQRFFGNVMEKGSMLNKGDSYILTNANIIYLMVNTLIMTQMTPDVFEIKINEIITCITMSDVIATKKPNVSLKYDPNVFGGRKKTKRKQ